ncbi:MAG: DUF1684 domain-containing protein [Chloroflexota bacterium]
MDDVEEWRRARYRRLREPMSWLTLVGLEWLRDGESRVGSTAEADIRLPSGPPVAGRLVRSGAEVTAHGEGGSGLTHDGREVDGLRLVSDVDAPEGEEATFLEVGPLRMCLIRRGERLGMRIWDTAAPARRDFTGIPHFPVGPSWRIDAGFEPGGPDETFSVPDVLGDVEEEPLAGTVAFEREGVTHRIKALDGGDGQLWLVFGDATNDDTTYGGGRFLYTDPPTPDGSVIVDFNRSYNPPCVFSPYATCPLPPAENRLPIRVEAGERRLAEH